MVVVIGAAGRTGSGVAEALLAAGQQVRVLVRRAEAAEAWRRRGADAQLVDLADAPALERALAGAAALFALVPEEPAASDFSERRKGIVRALRRALEQSGVKHTVLLSAAAAVLAAGNGPAAALHFAEQELASATRLTVLRAGYFQENVLASLPGAIFSGAYLNFLPPGASVPMVATRDVAQLAARCLLEPAQARIIDMIGPDYSPAMVAERIGQLIGRTVRVIEVAPERHLETLVNLGIPPLYAGALAELYGCFARAEVEPWGELTVRGATPLERTLANARREQRIATAVGQQGAAS